MEFEKEIERLLKLGGYSKAHVSKSGTKNEGKVSAGYRLRAENEACRLFFEKGNMVFFGMPPERVHESLLEMLHHLESLAPELAYTFDTSTGDVSVCIFQKN